MRILLAASTALTALALHAAPALAQTQVWSDTGELTDNDARSEDDHRYDDHVIRLEAGQRYRISLDSEAFDPLARLYRSTSEEPVAENDDGGESLNSRIIYTPGESGDYVLRATGYSADGRGAYSARVETMAPLPPPITSPGQVVSSSGNWSLWQGMLTDSSAQNDEGAHYQDYLIHAEAGQVRYISLTAGDFDPVLQVLRAADRDGENSYPIEEDDDGGVGLNSFLVFAPDEAGDYIVRVKAYSATGGGAYTLYISQ